MTTQILTSDIFQRSSQVMRPIQLAFTAFGVIKIVDIQKAVLARDQQTGFLVQFANGTNILQAGLRQLHSGERPILREHIAHVRRKVRRHRLG